MRARSPLGNLGDVQRCALVVRREDRRRGRYRWLLVLPAVAVLGVAVKVVSTDPVGYGVPFWPFADAGDHVESRVMDGVATAARDLGRLDAVPGAVAGEDGVEVLESRVVADQVLMRVRLRVPDGVRCRAVGVHRDAGVHVTSRRVEC